MTDNRTTELLCKLLEERGIEWKDGDAAFEVEWSTPDGRKCSAMYWKPTFTVLISGCTPEQAIAATLGEKPRDKTEEWLLNACNQATRNYVAQLEQEVDELESKLEATTFRGGTLTAEQVREAIEKRFDFDVWVPPARWQAIADELNAKLGSEID